MPDQDRDVDRFRLDPSRFPKRIDIFVPERVVEHNQAISARTGRSFSESAAVILAQGAEKLDPERFDRWVDMLMHFGFLRYCSHALGTMGSGI